MPVQKPGRSKQDYATDPAFMRAVKDYLDITTFAHDFAASQANTQALSWWDESTNALAQSVDRWRRHVIKGWGWLNPPFAHVAPWAERCAAVGALGGPIAFLVPAAVGSNWYRDYVNNKAFVLALNPRLSFDGKAPYPKDCILALYGIKPGFDVWTWR